MQGRFADMYIIYIYILCIYVRRGKGRDTFAALHQDRVSRGRGESANATMTKEAPQLCS